MGATTGRVMEALSEDAARALESQLAQSDRDMDGSQGEEDSERTGPQYQLGYVTAVEDMDNPDYMTRFHFPSKAGGKPAWMNPAHVPGNLNCGKCGRPLGFLCQVYAPLNPGEPAERPAAFHRMIYLFACNHGDCIRPGLVSDGSIRALRCQMPRVNSFYSPDALDPEAPLPEETFTEADDWKPDQFPEFLIENDSEPESDSDSDEDDDDTQELLAKYNERCATEGEIDMDELSELPSTKVDKQHSVFRKVMERSPEQVMRYCRHPDSTPLWVWSAGQSTSQPCCRYCGEQCKFELQLLPQILYFLKVDAALESEHQAAQEMALKEDTRMTPELAKVVAGKAIDFATICIYTCPASCGVDTASATPPLSRAGLTYRDEAVWVQLDESTELNPEAMKF